MGATLVDQGSLFIAAAVCAAALSLTMLTTWFNNRSNHFLIGWMAGMLLIATGVVLYYALPPDDLRIIALAFTLEIVGFAIIYVAARQFTGRPTSWWQALALFAVVPPVILPFAAGFDGLGITVYNFLAGILLAATGVQYWSARWEAPSAITAITTLYLLSALSFFACATILLHEGHWTLEGWPDNWAEQFNAIMCIAGITGIGALSIGLNNARIARRHREEARTDSLTGLLNRRALFAAMATRPLAPGQAVIVFDLDRFKQINDRYGHATGDEALRRFADAVRLNLRDGDLAARSGGEEFVLVLREASGQLAASTADRIRALFAAIAINAQEGAFFATASAGVALSTTGRESFEEVLHRADASLYRAKDGGRNRVVTELQAVA